MRLFKPRSADSPENRLVTCSRGVKIEADVLIGDVKHDQFDLIALPGGMPGMESLSVFNRRCQATLRV